MRHLSDADGLEFKYINLVHRCAEIKNYCIYIALDSDIIHSRQLWAACFERFVGKLYQERTFCFFPLIKSIARS